MLSNVVMKEVPSVTREPISEVPASASCPSWQIVVGEEKRKRKRRKKRDVRKK